MFKLKSNKTILNKEIVKLISCLIVIIFFISTSFAGQVSVAPLNFLNKRADSAKKNLEINSMQGKAVVKNLYSNSLKQVELSKINPMLSSVKSTTNALNNSYLCNIKDDDTINILYKSNDNFRKELKNITTTIERPTKGDMVASCKSLMACVLKSNNSKAIVDSISYCKILVNDIYLDEYKKNYNLGSLGEGNKGLDAFRNKSLDDSSYDILNDVYALAKILFDDAEEPAEILFYDMPNIGSAENMFDPYLSVVNDWYSPYYSTTNNPGGNSNSSPNGNQDQGEGDGEGEEPEGGPQVEGDLDYEITEFTQIITHEIEGKEGYEFLGNDCIDGFTIEGYDGYTYEEIITGTEMTPVEVANMINNNINNMDCEYDDRCDPDQNTEPTENPDTQDNLEGFLDDNPLFQDPKIISCFESCKDIPCNATSCDRLACYAKCLCFTYESPFFDPIENPGLGPVFKLKFCIQPVQDHKVVTYQKAYTLESIIKAINIVIQNLRNSGELMVNQETKEIMESSLSIKENKLSQNLTFSIDGYKKTPEEKGSEKQEKEDQINFNTSLMENVLGFEKQETVNGNGRNKYIIKGGTMEDGAVVKTETQSGLPETIDDNEIISSQKNTHLENMGSEIYEFLEGNLDFWQSFKDSMESIKTTAKSLANKK